MLSFMVLVVVHSSQLYRKMRWQQLIKVSHVTQQLAASELRYHMSLSSSQHRS